MTRGTIVDLLGNRIPEIEFTERIRMIISTRLIIKNFIEWLLIADPFFNFGHYRISIKCARELMVYVGFITELSTASFRYFPVLTRILFIPNL